MRHLGGDRNGQRGEGIFAWVPRPVRQAAKPGQHLGRVDAPAHRHPKLPVARKDPVVGLKRGDGAHVNRFLAQVLTPQSELALPLQVEGFLVGAPDQDHLLIQIAKRRGVEAEAAPGVSLELASRGEQGANRVVGPDDLHHVRHWETIAYRRYTADRLSARETRPTTTYAVAPADREPLHERLHGLGAVDEQPGPYEAWRTKLSDGVSQARAILYQSSKTVSDRELRGLASNIRQVVPEGQRAVLVLAPKRYNELYAQMRSEGKNLNTLLAWTHTRVIEDLIKSGLRPSFILSDQFGDKRYIESRLLMDTRLSGVPVVQVHRAEADVGVAAASILARDGFLRWLDQASKTLGVTLPKGASPKVIETARSLVSRAGADILKDYAKVSFKTMQKVLAP